MNKAGFVIHSAVHMARHDAACVAHTHTPAGMAVSAMECGLLPLAQTSMRFVHIAYHDFEGIADDVDERERLVQHLGNHEAMILRNHGLLVCGRDVPAAFNVLYRLERACEVQVMAMAANTKLVLPSKEILEETYDEDAAEARSMRTATAASPGPRCSASSTGSTPRTTTNSSRMRLALAARQVNSAGPFDFAKEIAMTDQQTTPAMPDMQSIVTKYWKLFLAEGIVLVLLGVGAIVVPPIAGLAVTLLLGWLFLIVGIFGLIVTFYGRDMPGFWWSLISAALAVLAGLILIARPLEGLLTLTVVLTAFFIIEGVASIMFALEHKRQLSGRWGWVIAAGIFDLLIAVVIFAGLPGSALWAIGLLVGINMVFGGSSLIGMALAAKPK